MFCFENSLRHHQNDRQMYWLTNALFQKCTDTPPKCSPNALIHKCFALKLHWYTNQLIRKCFDSQMHWYTTELIPSCIDNSQAYIIFWPITIFSMRPNALHWYFTSIHNIRAYNNFFSASKCLDPNFPIQYLGFQLLLKFAMSINFPKRHISRFGPKC